MLAFSLRLDRDPSIGRGLAVAVFAVACTALVHSTTPALGQDPQTGLEPDADVELDGTIIAAADVSAVTWTGEFLVIGSDEATGEDEKKNRNFIQVFEPTGENSYVLVKNIPVFESKRDEAEMDIEALASDGDMVYVIGSHSRKRPRVKAEKSYKKNRKALDEESVKPETDRRRLYRLELTSSGEMRDDSKKKASLETVLKIEDVFDLSRFIPSKENGVDIEGLAVKGDKLYAGFRGPVLRGNYVPVVRFDFDDPDGTYELRYVNLNGRGIRGMASVDDGFLLLAGPVGDGPASYQVYHWDGLNEIPGKGRPLSKIGKSTPLHELQLPNDDAKAEGLTVLSDEDGIYDIVVVYDGIEEPDKTPIAQRFLVKDASR